jgi:hypothetical protein
MSSALGGPGKTEVGRFVLYICELVMGTIVWGATSNKLLKFGGDRACYFGRGSNCGAIIFFGVVLTAALAAVAVMHSLKYCTATRRLATRVEGFAFLVFAVVWSLVAIISSAAAPPTDKTSAGNAVAFFSWASVVASVASCGIALWEGKEGVDELNHDLKV